MATLPAGKYQLKQLHQEIALFDRKLAHLLKYEVFRSDAERDAAAGKMNAKRALLVRNAQQMISEGITFESSEVPRSLREADMGPETAIETEDAQEEAAAPVAQQPTRHAAVHASPYAGTPLDFTPSLEGYKRSKKQA